MFNRSRAVAANERGNQLARAGDDQAAEAAYREAIALYPDYESAWFNVGLVLKRRRDWEGCRDANLRAAELDPRKEQPAWWNLGIAATALRDWPTARRAWKGYGVDIPDGDGPIEVKLGMTPVRIGLADAVEVVWCRRIDPARAIIGSIPLPESGHRYHDVVLHDGAPNGRREVNGHVYSVFDEIERWQPAEEQNVAVRLRCPREEDALALGKIANGASIPFEDWTANLNMLCKACSEGLPHEEHDRQGDGAWRVERNFGFVASDRVVAEVLELWRRDDAGREIEHLESY